MIPDTLIRNNVTDTCAVWHLIGSNTFFTAAVTAKVFVIITLTVQYECFVKTRKAAPTAERIQLRRMLRRHLSEGQITQVDLSIEDLQDVVAAAKRLGVEKRLGQGELSCAALARRLGSAAVLTDNRRDFRQIKDLVDGRLQTTPRLLGWLYVEGFLTDSNVTELIAEHEDTNGQMRRVYNAAYLEACQKRLMLGTSANQERFDD